MAAPAVTRERPLYYDPYHHIPPPLPAPLDERKIAAFYPRTPKYSYLMSKTKPEYYGRREDYLSYLRPDPTMTPTASTSQQLSEATQNAIDMMQFRATSKPNVMKSKSYSNFDLLKRDQLSQVGVLVLLVRAVPVCSTVLNNTWSTCIQHGEYFLEDVQKVWPRLSFTCNRDVNAIYLFQHGDAALRYPYTSSAIATSADEHELQRKKEVDDLISKYAQKKLDIRAPEHIGNPALDSIHRRPSDAITSGGGGGGGGSLRPSESIPGSLRPSESISGSLRPSESLHSHPVDHLSHDGRSAALSKSSSAVFHPLPLAPAPTPTHSHSHSQQQTPHQKSHSIVDKYLPPSSKSSRQNKTLSLHSALPVTAPPPPPLPPVRRAAPPPSAAATAPSSHLPPLLPSASTSSLPVVGLDWWATAPASQDAYRVAAGTADPRLWGPPAGGPPPPTLPLHHHHHHQMVKLGENDKTLIG